MIGATITPALNTWYEWHIVFALLGISLFQFGLMIFLRRKGGQTKGFCDTPESTHETRCNRKLGA